MKRSVFIGCLLLLSLAARGYDNTTHNFNTATSAVMTLTSGNKIGTMSDGTIYSCMKNATFTINSDAGGLCIKLIQGDSVIISPPKVGLRELIVNHYPSNIVLQVAISTDSLTWTPVGVQRTSSVRATGLSGDYYVKIKNTFSPKTEIYVYAVDYWTEPQNCNCFPYVPE